MNDAAESRRPAIVSRRRFLKAAAGGIALAGSASGFDAVWAQDPGARPPRDERVAVLGPQGRTPVSLIIDDSTCLVNLAHFAMPQFAETWPDREEYRKPWRDMPREIPDAFVREFGQWCRERGVKGKYSVVPYPACVGWLDRFLPGWSKQELAESVKLVRERIAPDWDIHPEMISHTRIVDTKTGRPRTESGPRFMENWQWTDGKSVDELADYMSYALRILKNIGLSCEGITTPGGFGAGVPAALAQAALDACRDVFQAEIPHYFRDLYTDGRSVAPRVYCASRLDGDDPRCAVSIIGCTGDWFGGWDGLERGNADLLITEDLQRGRLVEVVGRGEPAIIVCHWPGLYCGGRKHGFRLFQQVVQRLHARYDHLIWMKLSEIARYWAAKELTSLKCAAHGVAIRAPFACPRFTLSVTAPGEAAPRLSGGGRDLPLVRVEKMLALRPGAWTRNGEKTVACFDLPRGASTLAW
jgi:hypothetical protein